MSIQRIVLSGLILAAIGLMSLAKAQFLPSVRGPLFDLASGRGQVIKPESSIEAPADVGRRAHTNVEIFVPTTGIGSVTPDGTSPPEPGVYFQTPASLACLYGLSAGPAGCNPYSTTNDAVAGARAIAIVDAYHDATAMGDLTVFSQQFGLPVPTASTFQVIFASGNQPPINSGWNLEESLDIEWAHAMAPNATIYLVEAASNSNADLLTAVSMANQLLAHGSPAGGEVSMSWGGSEFSGETSLDSYFTQNGVVYFASAGDAPGVIWPSASPNVISTGGTSISRNPVSGNFQTELAWQLTGGGPSAYEPIPSYQSGIAGVIGSSRGTPDVASVADPTTGLWVYCSVSSCGYGSAWLIVGGTSAAAPVWAGIVNSEGRFAASSATELKQNYSNLGNSAWFTDIVNGSCGPYQGYFAAKGWDFCSGVGSPVFNPAPATNNLLTVTVTGSGVVTSSPAGISCGNGGACSASFATGTPIVLTATPANGWSFAGWGGACSGKGSCDVTMNSAQSVSATFTQNSGNFYQLSLSVAGPGVVQSSPAGINCGKGESVCIASFASGTPVTLTATPATGSFFVGWGGACAGGGACVVTMSANQSVSATFFGFSLDSSGEVGAR
jgi:kumamolisin